jgi:hypothetical protein
MSLKSFSILLIASSFLLAACGSSAIRQRRELRDRAVQSAKMYCEFVNGDVYPNDVDVALNIAVARHCESGAAVSMTQYKTPSESNGIMFCCPASPSTVAQVTRENRAQALKKAEATKKADDGKDAKDAKDVKETKDAKEVKPATTAPGTNDQDELDE